MKNNKILVIDTILTLDKLKLRQQFRLLNIRDQIMDLQDEAESVKKSIDSLTQRTQYELDKHRELLEEK